MANVTLQVQGVPHGTANRQERSYGCLVQITQNKHNGKRVSACQSVCRLYPRNYGTQRISIKSGIEIEYRGRIVSIPASYL